MQNTKGVTVPMVTVKEHDRERTYDIFSRLLESRIVFLQTPIDSAVASVVNAQLMHLNNESTERPIELWISSPGGEVSSGLSIHDVMRHVEAPVYTICSGTAASMGAFLLAAGDKRYATQNSRVMIHQPLGGTQGQVSDIKIQAEEIEKLRNLLESYLSEYTGQPYEKINTDCERDFHMNAQESKDYGIIDDVIKHKKVKA